MNHRIKLDLPALVQRRNPSGPWGNREFTRQHITVPGAPGGFFSTRFGGTINPSPDVAEGERLGAKP